VSDGDDRPETWEEKLVYYADKRVMHEKIVPLQERLDEGHRRSAAARRKAGLHCNIDTEKIDALIVELEREIFEAIGIKPDEVDDAVIERDEKDRGECDSEI
jgi:hypothetical protein